MKVKDVISQIEMNMGRQPEGYIMRLLNDALLDIGAERQHKVDDVKMDLVKNQRWYELASTMLDISRVEVMDNNGDYIQIPRNVLIRNMVVIACIKIKSFYLFNI